MWPLCLIVVQSSIMGGVGRLYHTQWHFGHKSSRSPLFQMIQMGQTRPLGLNFQLLWKGERKIKICERKRLKFFNMHMLVKVFPGDDPLSNLWVRLEWWCWTLSQFHQPTNPLWTREVPISEMPSLMNIWWLPFANVKKMWCLTHLLDDQDNQIIKCHRSFVKNCQFSQQNWAV